MLCIFFLHGETNSIRDPVLLEWEKILSIYKPKKSQWDMIKENLKKLEKKYREMTAIECRRMSDLKMIKEDFNID